MIMNNNWQLKKFNELSSFELYQLIKLRIDVFIVEQQCHYSDLDNLDHHPETLHLFGYASNEPEENPTPCAYLRILPKETRYPNNISIGRVLVTKQAREKGLGHQLIDTALQYAKQYFPKQSIKISAQSHLQGFYEQHGFMVTGEPYFEDNIPHIAMLKE